MTRMKGRNETIEKDVTVQGRSGVSRSNSDQTVHNFGATCTTTARLLRCIGEFTLQPFDRPLNYPNETLGVLKTRSHLSKHWGALTLPLVTLLSAGQFSQGRLALACVWALRRAEIERERERRNLGKIWCEKRRPTKGLSLSIWCQWLQMRGFFFVSFCFCPRSVSCCCQ